MPTGGKDLEIEVLAAELLRAHLWGPDLRRGVGLDCPNGGIDVEFSVAAVIVDTKGAVARLLDLGEQHSAADCMDGTSGYQNDRARDRRDRPQKGE